MSDDRFFDRLRADARPLRYEAGPVVATRLLAGIRSRLTQPTISEFIVAWFRPLAASLSALALVAAIGIAILERDQQPLAIGDPVQYTVAGDTYSVGE